MIESGASESRSGEPGKLRLGAFECEPLSHTVKSSTGKVWTLKPKTMDLLVFLADNQGRVVSKDQIFEAVWTDTFVGDSVLWKCISELRQVLGDDLKNPKNPQIIVTIPKRGYRLDPPEGSQKPKLSLRRKRWRTLVIVAASLVLMLLGWWFSQDSTLQITPLSVSERPMILVAQIDNQTGESILDGTLEYAFESNLLLTEMVRTASRARIEETLSFMGKAADTSLDESLAREMSMRDGAIAAILTGNVAKLGNEYELGIRLIDPATGENLFASMKRAKEADFLLETVSELSSEVVLRLLGRNEVPPSPAAADRKVRTASLAALQSYLRGVHTYRNASAREAEVLFKRAIEIDPEFASAHLMLAWSFRRQLRETEANTGMEAAMALRDHATPAEQAFIQGSYHYWRGEYEAAWSHYELLLELEPDHPWAMSNLTVIAKRSGSLDRMAQLIVKTAAAATHLLTVQERGASILVEVLGRLDLARPLINRCRALLQNAPSDWSDESGWRGAWISSFGVWERWLEGDVEATLSEANRVRGWLEGERSQESSPQRHAAFLGLQYLSLGRVKDARELIAEFGPAPGLYLTEMTVLSSVTLDEELLIRFQQMRPSRVASLLRLLFRPPKPEERTFDFPWPKPEEPRGQIVRPGSRVRWHIYSAGLAIDEENFAEAIEELRQAREMSYIRGVPHVLSQSLIMLELARLYEATGERAQAIKVLEELSSLKEQSYPATGIVWLFGQAHLADLYRQAGKAKEADSIENELRELLKFADDDHPLRVKLTG